MAGDWIKMRLDLAEDPAVIEMADELGVREETVVGYCHAFWCWASRQCHDGRVTGVTLTSLGRVLSLPGFPEILVKVGWLKYQESGLKPVLEIPHFERHLSESAKTRALAANRKSRQRVPKMSRTERDKTGTREEESREESLDSSLKKEESPPDKPGGDCGECFALQTGTFLLPPKRLAEYRATYQFDVGRELRKAAGWLRDNKARRPRTSRGGISFLTRWLNRTADKHTGNGHAPTGRVVNDAARLAEKKHAAAVRRLKARGVEVTDASVKKEMNDG